MSDPTELPGPSPVHPGRGQTGPLTATSEAQVADAGQPAPVRKDRRALLVGVQRYLDPGMALRPGTCAAIRQMAALLSDPQHGGWQVELLLDDEPSEDRRPMLANLLERFEWLQKAEEALLVLSGRVRSGLFLPRDARPTLMARTSVSLGEISTSLPKESSVIIDAPVDAGAFPAASWVLAAAPRDAAESFPNERGPTAFLSATIRALQGEGSSDGDVVTARRLAEVVIREAHPAWMRGERDTVLARPGIRPTHCVRCGKVVSDPLAVYCPGCGSALRAVEHLDGGRYRIIRPLGSGGMGTVYLAEDTRLKVNRALKLLSVPAHLPAEDHESLKQRLVQECRAAQALADRSGHVVRVFDVGYSQERSEPFLVMELLQGRTLAQRLAEGRLTISGSVKLGLTIADTVAHAHEAGIIHRDLKPDNVYLHYRGVEEPEYVKLLDFGLAKMTETDIKTQSGRLMGTLQYMPPEQLRGERVEPRADVFSLGAILYECLSGERAVPGRTQGEIFKVLLDTGVRPLRELEPDLPPKLLQLLDRCLALDSRERPVNAREVATFLAEILSEMSEEALARTVSAEGDEAGQSTARSVQSAIRRETSLPGTLQVPERTLWERVGPASKAGGGLVVLALVVGYVLSRKPGDMTQAPLPDPAASSAAVTPADAGPPPRLDLGLRASDVKAPILKAAGLMPAVPVAEPERDGDYVIYRGGTTDDQIARLVVDLTLSEAVPPAKDAAALARWTRTAPAVRAWLGGLIDLGDVERRESGASLAVRRDKFERQREHNRPATRNLPALGTLLVFGEREPIFEKVRCGTAQAGDSLTGAQWSTPGYGGGQCDGMECADSLARGLLNARQVGETSTLRLSLSREGTAGEPHTSEQSGRVETRCRVGDAVP